MNRLLYICLFLLLASPRLCLGDDFFRPQELPPLPEPLGNMAAALLDGVVYIAGGRRTPAIALSTVTGINVHLCILVMGVLATVYTVLGGSNAGPGSEPRKLRASE